jgi:predicted acyl esterase
MFMRSALLALLAALAVAAPAAAQSSPFDDCPAYGDQRICTAQVPSFDGTPLDVDLTLPEGGGASHPLIVLLHGFGNDKREWESLDDRGDGADKLRWNSHWFARHGFYVLTYTARGFRTGEPDEGKPPTPSGSSESLPSGTIQIKSREVEVRDTQYLASKAADAFADLDRDRVAVSGGSYGGGESWLQAADPVWDDFTSPSLRLQVAVPKYPWTDLAFALAPNGRGTLAGERPIGTAKASYITGLFATGNANGTFEQGTRTTPTSEGPISVPAWNARLVVGGDPYSPEDPVVAQARRGLTEYRSAFYQDFEDGPRAAVFSISGWTDDLFEAVESFRMFDRLKAIDPRWPVEVAVADIGHSRAQNRPAQWQRLNAQAWQFLRSNLSGAHDQQTTVSSQPTLCGTADDDSAQRVTATSPAGLAAGELRVAYTRGAALDQTSGADDPDGPATDAIAGGIVAPGRPADGCTQSARSPGQQTTGYTALSAPLPKPRTYVGTGAVTARYVLAGPGATLHARVWDVARDGTALLMTRGTYRLDTLAAGDPDAPAGTVRLPLYGNHWPLEAGHRVRLDLQQVDAPTFRPTNLPNRLTLQPPALTLPTREAGALALGGG